MRQAGANVKKRLCFFFGDVEANVAAVVAAGDYFENRTSGFERSLYTIQKTIIFVLALACNPAGCGKQRGYRCRPNPLHGESSSSPFRNTIFDHSVQCHGLLSEHPTNQRHVKGHPLSVVVMVRRGSEPHIHDFIPRRAHG